MRVAPGLCVLLAVGLGGPAAAVEISFEEALARAAEADSRLTETRLRETEATLFAHEQAGRLLPTVTVGASLTRNAREVAVGEGSGRRVVAPLVSSQGTLLGRVRLFRGSDIPGALSAYTRLQGERAALEETREALLSEVASLYLDLAEAQALEEVLARQVETAQALVLVAKAKVAHGTGIPLEVDEAEAELLRAEAERAEALGRAHEIAVLFALRVGLERGEAPKARCAGCVPLPSDEVKPQRGDLVALEQQADAARLVALGAWLDLLPSVDLVANGRLSEPTLFHPDPFWWNAELVLSWELFSGTTGVAGALGRGTEAERLRLEAERAQAEASVAKEQARVALKSARAREKAARARVAAATRALENAEARYREGMLSAADLTETARRRAEAEAALVRARFAVERATLRLRRALGLAPTSTPELGLGGAR